MERTVVDVDVGNEELMSVVLEAKNIVEVVVVADVVVDTVKTDEVEVETGVPTIVDGVDDTFIVEKLKFAKNPVTVVCLEKLKDVSVAFHSVVYGVNPKYSNLCM